MIHKMKALLVLGAFALVAGTAQAQIATTAKCETAKVKCVVNKVKGLLNCEGKAAKLGALPDSLCLAKARAKFTAPGVCQAGTNIGDPCTVVTQAVDCPGSVCKVKACMDKADSKNATVPCLTLGDGPAMESKVDAFVSNLKTTLYTNPAPIMLNGCFAAQQKCVSNFVKGVLNCESKAVKTGLPTDSLCLAKAAVKFTGDPLKSCMDKLDATGKACDTVGASGQGGATKTSTQAFVDDVRAELMPNNKFVITTQVGAGNCGSVDSTAGALLALPCGSLAIGDGGGTVPPGATPPNSTTKFSALGTSGPTRSVVGAPATITGSNRNCSRAGCFFGSPLPIHNGALSTCVANSFTTTASGVLNIITGSFTGNIPLQSTVTVTGNDPSPCPVCVAGLCTNSVFNGAPCNPDSSTGESHDCVAAGVVLPPFPVALNPIITGLATATAPSGFFCPGQVNAGAFGQAAGTSFKEQGQLAGDLTNVGTDSQTLASVFCIPATGNVLIDGSAGLPGPGALSLPLTVDLQ